MLGLDNPIHIAFVLVVLLLIFGAKRLPEMGKSMGEGLRGFKESISGESSHHAMTADDTDHSPVRVDELPQATSATPLTTEHTDERPRVTSAA